MADEIVLDENGVPMSNGLGGTESSDDTNTGQGGGATSPTTNSTSGTSGTTATTSTPTTSSDSDSPETDEEKVKFVEDLVAKYLAFSQIPGIDVLTYKELVPIYVDNKLGFAELKKQYKKDNPDVDPAEVDKAVDEERQNAIQEFGGDPENPPVNSTAEDELKKKYDDFERALAQMNKDLKSLLTEAAKVIAEAFMPTTIGLGAPNPLSIVLKLYNGLTKIKKILDRVFTAMALFISTSKALGLDGTPGYRDIMVFIAERISPIQNLIAKQESDASYQEDLALQDYLQTAKENWPAGQSLGIDYETVEGYGKDGISYSGGGENKILTISMWPIQDPKDRQKLVKLIDSHKKYNGGGINDTKIFKMEAMLTYNDYLGWASKEFKKYYKQLADTNKNNNSTDTTSDTNSSGGSNNNIWKSNTYGLSGLNKEGTK